MRALEIAQCLEAAARNVKVIQNGVGIKANGRTGSSQDNP